jgi:thiamine biosynthesis lipoprotein
MDLAARGLIRALLLATCLLAGCAAEPQVLRFEGPTMGTSYHVTVIDPPGGAARADYQSDIDTVLARVDASMSTWRADSEISRLNVAPVGENVGLSPELHAVLAESLAVNRLSGGAFDVTIAPVLAAWGFGPGSEGPHIARAEALAALAGRVGSEALVLSDTPPALRKVAARSLELSAIAPGYAVDLLARAFAARGLRDFMIEIGGEVRTGGRTGAGRPWRIGVEQPDAPPGTPAIAVTLADGAVSTSGDYREFFIADGMRYSHTIDPRTLRPVSHALASVTVIATDCMRADAMATALMVLGPEEGLALAEREGLAVYMLLRGKGGFEARQSSTFAPYLAPIESP